MNDLFEYIENVVWTMGDNALDHLRRLYPDADIKIVSCEPLNLPPNIITCCATGAGEITPVKRLALVEARCKEDTLYLLTLEEIWTSPYAVPWNTSTWEMFYWDVEKDEEVFLN